MIHAAVVNSLTVKIVPRVRGNNEIFAEIFYRWFEQGRERFALSRVNYPVNTDPHTVAYHREAFMKRQGWK
jgi:hypothetical protein